MLRNLTAKIAYHAYAIQNVFVALWIAGFACIVGALIGGVLGENPIALLAIGFGMVILALIGSAVLWGIEAFARIHHSV